jgi:hypothetical protein
MNDAHIMAVNKTPNAEIAPTMGSRASSARPDATLQTDSPRYFSISPSKNAIASTE